VDRASSSQPRSCLRKTMTSSVLKTESVCWRGPVLVVGWAVSWTGARRRPGKWFTSFFFLLLLFSFYLPIFCLHF
jgi:hypothetical protein